MQQLISLRVRRPKQNKQQHNKRKATQASKLPKHCTGSNYMQEPVSRAIAEPKSWSPGSGQKASAPSLTKSMLAGATREPYCLNYTFGKAIANGHS